MVKYFDPWPVSMEGKGGKEIGEKGLKEIETVLQASIEVGEGIMLEKIYHLLEILVHELNKNIILGQCKILSATCVR